MTQMPIIHQFIYKDSPFLPYVTEDLADNISDLLKSDHQTPISLAIAQTLYDFGYYHYLTVARQIDFLEKFFGCDDLGLIHWLLGYATPSKMITGAFIALDLGTETALEFIAVEEKETIFDEQLERYRQDMLKHSIKLITQDRTGEGIYRLIAQYPMYSDTFYQIGLIASHKNHFQLLHSLKL